MKFSGKWNELEKNLSKLTQAPKTNIVNFFSFMWMLGFKFLLCSQESQ